MELKNTYTSQIAEIFKSKETLKENWIKSIKNNEYNCVPVSFFIDRINQYQINKQKEYKVIEFQKIFIDV